ncbi:MAG TPA: DEAD/DEAH box helicase [Thermoanaerobaculia bacterium]
MSVPDRFRAAFSSSTLQTLEANGGKLDLRDPLFFRTAYTGTVVENERRTFTPIALLEPARVVAGRCTCVAWMRPDDLCRHVAVLVSRIVAGDGALPGEQFESSIWRAIGFASFSEARELTVRDADPREQVLRKYVLTDQEQELIKRGSGSTRLLWEASPWYRWAKSMFLRFGDAGGATLVEREGAFYLLADGVEVPLPVNAVEQVIEARGGAIARAGGFDVVREAVTPSFRIELTAERALRFVPVLLTRDQKLHERLTLPRYGRWFLLGKLFATPMAVPAMFAEKASGEQSFLFDMRPATGLPFDRETVIPEDEVFEFIEKHRESLAKMPAALAPENVRNAQPVRLEDEVVFDFAAPHRDLLEVSITFKAGSEHVTAAELAKARKDGLRALNRGSLWIDVTDPQFSWLDGATVGKNGRVLLTKLELLRVRGSLRGTQLFQGDPSCERVFRMVDELQVSDDAPSPSDLGMDLYAYQQTGYHWLWLLQQNGFGGLLCDDMGLGKTHQAMALIRGLTHVNPELSVLVVCPTSLLDHWREKLAMYVPEITVTLTSYGIVRSRIEQFRGRKFDVMILDEMQTIKNAETSTHQALRAIDKRIAIGLTGTPVENHERELKALLDFVVPGYLPKYVDDTPTLQRLVRPFVLRRTKSQVLTQLPPKIVDKRYCELTTEQRALYRKVAEARAKPLRALLRGGGKIPYIHVFAALNYLKQICNHPASVSGGFATEASSGKWELFVDLINECMASGLKVVVFSQYLKMMELIEEHLEKQEIGYASIKGATRERGQQIWRFREDPDCRVFTASLRAGGLGIDLTSASVVIHYDRWWNQAREDQATDRVHRLGQNKGVQVIKLITRGTVEEKIDELIAKKADLATDLIRPDDPALVKQFTVDELEGLLGYEE